MGFRAGSAQPKYIRILPPRFWKRGEIGIGGVENLVDALQPGGVLIQIELVDVVLRIGLGERQVAEEILAEVRAGGGGAIVDGPGIPAAASVLPGDFAADGPGGKDALARRCDFGVEFVERADLRER